MVVRNTLVRTLDDDVIAAVERFHETPGPVAVAVRSLGGAFSRVPSEATAFAHRDAEAMIVGVLMLPETVSDPDVEQALGVRAEPQRGAGAG